MKRIALINEDGTTEIGGVRHKLVPVDCIEAALESLGSFCSDHGWSAEDMDNMDRLAAAASAKHDMSALPEMKAYQAGHAEGIKEAARRCAEIADRDSRVWGLIRAEYKEAFK